MAKAMFFCNLDGLMFAIVLLPLNFREELALLTTTIKLWVFRWKNEL